MNPNLTRFLKKLGTAFALLFFVLFLSRWLFTNFAPREWQESMMGMNMWYYSSSNAEQTIHLETLSGELQHDPSSVKYDQNTMIRSYATNFEAEVAQVQAEIKRAKAEVYFEKIEGIQGGRLFKTSMGIEATQLQMLQKNLAKIGTLTQVYHQKANRTQVFENIKATKIALEKNLNALYQLENRKGQISDFIALHEKIHYLEKDYQALKIQEAKFTSNKGLTSVWYVLSESRDGYVRPSLTMNALEALKWATETQFFLTLMATG